jgi:hypothetical protein
MALPEVAHAQALSKLMASALKEYSPASLAVIGCTTGNGLENIDPTQTNRIVGVDINAAYLAVLQLPSPESSPATVTRYKSLELLAPIMNLISPSEFSRMCNSLGLQQKRSNRAFFHYSEFCRNEDVQGDCQK